MGRPNKRNVGGWEIVYECRIDDATGIWSEGVWSPSSEGPDVGVDDEQLDGLLARIWELSGIGHLWERFTDIEIECVPKTERGN